MAMNAVEDGNYAMDKNIFDRLEFIIEITVSMTFTIRQTYVKYLSNYLELET